MTKYTLYVGLNDKYSKVQEISTIEAFKIVSNVLASHTGGGTIYEAHGIYTHEDGSIVIENTLRCEVITEDRRSVDEAVRIIKQVLNQESVIIQRDDITSEIA